MPLGSAPGLHEDTGQGRGGRGMNLREREGAVGGGGGGANSIHDIHVIVFLKLSPLVSINYNLMFKSKCRFLRYF